MKPTTKLAQKWSLVAALPAIGLAIIPHMTVCPACWSLVGGLVSALGLSVVLEGWLATPVTIILLTLALVPIGLQARKLPKVFTLALAAAATIITGRLLPQFQLITFAGIALFIVAYIWSLLANRTKSGCSPCAPTSSTEGDVSVPIACSLDRVQFEERRTLLAKITATAVEKLPILNGYAICFKKAPGTIPAVASFIDMEQACCPFLSFRIEVNAGANVRLELTGPVEAQEIIRELVALPA